jgi:glycosyltransferase involved in cell wall biosynthesis
VLAISDYTRDELIKHNAVSAEKIRIFPCTLDPHWKMGPCVTNKECKSLVILSVTRMSKEDRYKGIDNVIRSMPDVVCEVGAVEYRIVGQGDDVPRLRALAAGLGVERYVNFMGGVSDEELREQYRQCSLFVMPSRKEGFGIVFLEAMAYGKPVVGGSHGGTPSVVVDGETGLLVDNSDVAGIARSITKLLRDEEMCQTFGHAGRQRLLDKFTFEEFERNLKEVFCSLS